MNPIVSNVITAVVTAAIMGVIAWAGGLFKAGSDAVEDERIRVVLEAELKTDAGKAFKTRLSEVDQEITKLETRVDGLRGDVEDLEDIAFSLAGGQ